MAKIGSFKKVSSEIKGQITTLGFQAKAVRFVPEENASGNAPAKARGRFDRDLHFARS